jgi:hypothetical protein
MNLNDNRSGTVTMKPIEDLLVDIATQNEDAYLAIAQCALRLPESAPPLRALLARAANGECRTAKDANLLFAGLHILGGRRDSESFPDFVRLLHRPNDELDYLLGDISLSRIAAGLFDGNAGALFEIVLDPTIDSGNRFDLFGTIAFLTWEGRIDRQATVRFLERFDDERPAESGSLVWSGWELAISLLGLEAMVPRVESAFRDQRIDSSIGSLSEFRKTLIRAKEHPDDIERFRDEHLGYIEDVLEEMERFEPGSNEDMDDYLLSKAAAEHARESRVENYPFYAEPAINPLRHVGRNDPCPCGSGKKFKKCCLGKPEI